MVLSCWWLCLVLMFCIVCVLRFAWFVVWFGCLGLTLCLGRVVWVVCFLLLICGGCFVAGIAYLVFRLWFFDCLVVYFSLLIVVLLLG